ncbi:BTB POZ domain-containing 9 [Brachionus plicatilis]|uniref:BTB POZ domain-containing 9 n=1 Tax=Brachionus plicatilis TaxID=10195 RepID=A0A3M7QFU5_BRAPC|nr:BTB POZ domain-containing 9 [Brachionus plicatilis]
MQSLNEMFTNSAQSSEPQPSARCTQSQHLMPAPNQHTFSSMNTANSSHIISEINHVKQLATDIGNLFLDTDYADVKLIVDGVEFNAHKIVLAARSQYFRALLFSSGMSETNSSCIQIKEAKASAFRLLLQYIYKAKVNLKNEKEELLIDLLSLAHQYGFVDLQKSVSDYLESILDVKNVCSIYEIASLYQLSSLGLHCLRFIDKNCLELLRQNSLLHLSSDSLSSVIERDSFCAPELHIFSLVREWHELNKCAEAKPQLISKIRLPLMQLDELLNQVRLSKLIDSDVILDAIKLKHESNESVLNYRGVLYPDENVATCKYQAAVLKGEFKSALLDGDVLNYDFDRGFTYHPIDDSMSSVSPSSSSSSSTHNCIVVKLGNSTILNHVRLLLWDKDTRSYSYYIEVSMNEKDWLRVVDYSDYLCRSWQNLFFKPVVARYVRVVGVRNTANRIFHLVSMEIRYTTQKYDILNELIVPQHNVATIGQSAFVLEGVSRSKNALINGDYKNYDWDTGYTCHQLGSGCILVQLAQPFVIGSMRLLLWDCDKRSYSYCIETSLDQCNWSMVADKRNEACRSWQIIVFPQRPVSFVRITGTHNTANEVFHCVHFESPCDPEILNRYLENHAQLASQYSNICPLNINNQDRDQIVHNVN